jgi:hypothetical protein
VGSEASVSGRVEPTYRPSREHGEIVVYAGNLDVKVDDETRTVKGQLELRLGAGPLVARFAGAASEDLHFVAAHEATASVSVPAGAPLVPSPATILRERREDTFWIEARIAVRSELAAGEAARAQRFIFHISGALEAWLPPVEVDGRQQAQLEFRLPDWRLVIAAVADRRGERDFKFVVEATPASPPSAADVDRLTRRLFILLSLVASREVGVGPVCGLTNAGEVVWASWGSPRLRPGRPGVRWCPPHLVAKALPAIAEGFARLSEQDEAMGVVVDRAINHLLAADGNEPLDVRVPVACVGLEMLGWAILQRHGWADKDVLEKMPAAAMTRLLLRWTGVPTTIPAGFDALAARRDSRHRGGGSPEVLWGVRNKLVHPPNRLDNPEWPSSAELVECWQLANWFLELVVLRVLGYEGQYWSRLRLGRYGADVEQVPWTAGCAAANCS